MLLALLMLVDGLLGGGAMAPDEAVLAMPPGPARVYKLSMDCAVDKLLALGRGGIPMGGTLIRSAAGGGV